MILFIISLILLIMSSLCFYFALQITFDKIKQLNQQKKEIQQKKDQLSSLNKKIFLQKQLLNDTSNQLNKRIDFQKQVLNDTSNQLKLLYEQQDKLNKQLENKEKNIEKYYAILKNQAEESFNCYENILDNQYKEIENSFNNQVQKLEVNKKTVESELNELKSTYQTAAAAAILQKEQKDKQNFYSIILSPNELNDINKLQQWKNDLSDPSIVGKVIWSTYIIKPAGELCNRIVGLNKISGIYKITNKTTKKIYIGQSVDISNRIKTHIKCGLGIDTPPTSANKLYKAMQNSSLQQWMFEVLEKCSSNKLNEREKYWIDFYQSDKIGYNSNKGIKNASKD